MKVEVQVDDRVFETDSGPRSGLEVTCTRCGRTEQVYGRSTGSAKAGAMMLRANCQNGESNFYDLPEWVKLNS